MDISLADITKLQEHENKDLSPSHCLCCKHKANTQYLLSWVNYCTAVTKCPCSSAVVTQLHVEHHQLDIAEHLEKYWKKNPEKVLNCGFHTKKVVLTSQRNGGRGKSHSEFPLDFLSDGNLIPAHVPALRISKEQRLTHTIIGIMARANFTKLYIFSRGPYIKSHSIPFHMYVGSPVSINEAGIDVIRALDTSDWQQADSARLERQNVDETVLEFVTWQVGTDKSWGMRFKVGQLLPRHTGRTFLLSEWKTHVMDVTFPTDLLTQRNRGKRTLNSSSMVLAVSPGGIWVSFWMWL